jgi:hypothetical protein
MKTSPSSLSSSSGGFTTIFCLLLIAQIVVVRGFSPFYPKASRIASISSSCKQQSRSVSTWRWASIEDQKATVDDSDVSEESGEKKIPFYKLPKAAYKIYTNYFQRLWKETDVTQREKISKDKVRGAIRNMQNILVHANEYAEFDDVTYEKKQKLMASCEEMLDTLPKPEKPKERKRKKKDDIAVEIIEESKAPAPKKKQRSILFGALMGLTVAGWVFSGNYVFTGLFCLMTILGQLEYYRMVMNTGVYAARRISVIGASSMFLTVRYSRNEFV